MAFIFKINLTVCGSTFLKKRGLLSCSYQMANGDNRNQMLIAGMFCLAIRTYNLSKNKEC